ncbi:CAI-1 autoinducer sensor kinase/phosphatase CqsS [Lachnospiraceae bacterium]|nr:CAI-1 autoinducer sensor kinase/phosphatase CqsS [Lachnospiraceae bacterium]
MGEHVSIILMTAYDWAEIEEEARDAGVTVFCGKPMFLSELRRCLYSLVHTKEASGEGEAEKQIGCLTGRILLAEDNELNQEIAEVILEEAGFTVEIAEDGQKALNMLKKSEAGYYQLVLMDIQMPNMNGYEAARAIRGLENRELAEIPIIAMTANAFEEDRQEALKSGMNAHIAKPIDIGVLFEALEKILA